ncbi:MAG: hypothetical protein JWN94_2068 [Betaproteobacteria bacterium]|nr:hypothetical protein [Betaproteobacteria bacterium]
MTIDSGNAGSQRFYRLWRAVGWMFFALGSLLTAVGLWQLTDPNSQILFNGVHTTAAGPKWLFMLFSAAFALFGIAALLLPARHVDRMHAQFMLWLSTWRAGD